MSFLITSIIFSITLYFIARHRNADKVFWSVLGFLFGPFALPFVFFSKPQIQELEPVIENKFYNQTEAPTSIRKPSSTPTSSIAAIISSISLVIFLLTMTELGSIFTGKGEMHPFTGMFYAVFFGIFILFAYVLGAIGGIIAVISMVSYKSVNPLSVYSALVFIIINLILVSAN